MHRTAMLLRAASLLLTATAAVAAAAGGVVEGTWSDEFDLPGLPGRVFGLGSYQGQLVAGGMESASDGHFLEHLALWNGTTWEPVGAGVNGIVRAVAEYQGDLVVGGEFTQAGGTPAAGIARWDGQQWHALGGGLSLYPIDPVVWDLTTFQGNLYVAGWFDTAGGMLSRGIARWDGTTWSSVGGGITGPYEPKGLSLEVASDGLLYLGGEFDRAGGVPARNVARWNGAQWAALGGGISGPGVGVFGLAEFQGQIYAGGNFQQAGSVFARRIARFDGTDWAPVGKGIPDWDISAGVTDLEVFQGSLYVGGDFIEVDATSEGAGIAAPRVARWDGQQWHGVGGVVGGDVSTTVIDMTVLGDRLYVGGEFTVAGTSFGVNEPVVSVSIAAFDGAAWEQVGKGLAMNTGAAEMIRWRGKLWAMGMFIESGGNVTQHLAYFEDGDWHGVGHVEGNVWHAVVFEDDLVISGEFKKINGQSAQNTARFDGTQWHEMYGGGGALEVHAGQLYAAGLGSPRRWNGFKWESFGVELYGQTYDLHSHGGVLYFSGTYNLAPSQGILAWDGQSLQPVAGGLDGTGTRMASWQGDLIVGGDFDHAGGVFAPRIARWDGQQWHALGQPMTGLGVKYITTLDGELYVAGDLMTNSTSPIDALARLDTATGLWQPVGPSHVKGYVGTLFGDEVRKSLWISGSFLKIGTIPCYAMGRLDLASPWSDAGFALDGTYGTPLLIGTGTPAPGAPCGIVLENARRNALFGLVIGATAAEVPFLGGTLVPAPNLVIPGLPTGAAGGIALSAPWPAQVPAGASFLFQAWVADPAGPQGFAATNALRLDVP